MRPEGQFRGDVILDHLFAQCHVGQVEGRLIDALALHIAGEQRQGPVAFQRARLPQRLPPGQPQRGKGIRLCQPRHRGGGNPGAPPHDAATTEELEEELRRLGVDASEHPEAGFGLVFYSDENAEGGDAAEDGDAGSAARFFYCAKASKKDRNEGLDHIDSKISANKGNGLQRVCSKCGITQRGDEVCQDEDNCPKEWVNPPKKNNHPTVKPTDLMCYLVRLVTPPNGTVLDPFMGSGSTGKACMVEGCDFIGIELDEEYIEIARARIEKSDPGNTLEDIMK